MNLISALHKGDRQGVNRMLTVYRIGSGFNFPALLSLPERLPAMFKREPKETAATIVVALTGAFETMNLSRPMNSAQIVELAETILDSSTEDYLALEDVLLFLQGLTRGKYGPLYESMDIPKFMQLFEVYREERHQQYQSIKEESHIQNKILPVNDRITDMFPDEFKDKQRAAQIQDLKSKAQ